jgi:hypothetical protein
MNPLATRLRQVRTELNFADCCRSFALLIVAGPVVQSVTIRPAVRRCARLARPI